MTKAPPPDCPYCFDPHFALVREDPRYTVPDAAIAHLERLHDALNALPGARALAWRCLSGLTESDIMALLVPAPVRTRASALRFLGLSLSPRNVSRSLCRDALQRLGAATVEDGIHFVAVLSRPVVDALLSAVDGTQDGPFRWSPSLAAGVLWNGLSASAEGARVLVWASDQEWWPGTDVDRSLLTEVLEAAEATVEATPDFVHRIHRVPIQPTPHPSEKPPDMTTEPSSAPPGEPEASTGELLAGRAELDLRHTRAREAVAALGEALAAGRRLPDTELADLEAYDTGLAGWAGHLGLDPDEITLGDLDAILAERGEHERSETRIRGLLELTDLPGIPPDRIALLHELVEQSREGRDDALREALTGLAELVELSSVQHDPVTLQQSFQSVASAISALPDELYGLPMAVIMNAQRLSAPAPRTADGETHAPAPSAVRTVPVDPGDTFGTVPPTAAGAAEPEAPRPPVPGADPAPEPRTAAPDTPASAPPVPTPTAGALGTGGPTDAREVAAPVRHDTEPAFHRLVAQRRFSLAITLAEATGQDDHRIRALRVAALADHLRGPNGPCAVRLRNELVDLDPLRLTEDTSALLLISPALIRAALVTGESTAGALLDGIAPHLEGHLSAVALAVGQRTLKGLLVGNPLGTTLADTGRLEERLDRASREAGERLSAPRNLRYSRATKLAQLWFSEQGLVGSLLAAAAADDRSRSSAVAERLIVLSRKENLNKEIDRADVSLRRSSNRVLQGAARNNLVSLVESALTVVSNWLDAVSALEHRDDQGRAWALDDLTDMRRTVLQHLPQARAVLAAQASDATMTGAVHAAAVTALEQIGALVEEGVPTGQGEPLPDHVLTVELLKVAHATVAPVLGRVSVPKNVGPADVALAADLDWAGALDLHIRTERYPTARYLVDLIDTGVITPGEESGAEHARNRIEVAEQRSREDLTRARDELFTMLQKARMQQEVSEEQDGHLSGLLNFAAQLATADLAPVRERIDQAYRSLPEYRREAASRLTERLGALLERTDRPDVEEGRIRALIDEGQLLIAEELIYFCEIGEPVPEPADGRELSEFFPRVPDGLPQGITAGLVETARSGGVFTLRGGSGLDFGGLSTDARDLVADALSAWREARDTPPKQRNQISRRTLLVQSLRLLGYDIPPAATFHELRLDKGLDRGFFEFSKVTCNGRPTVPEFGSKLHGRLRVLVCWGQPRADLLRSWVEKDTSGESLLVAYLGTMSAEVRRRFAVEAVRISTPVVVVDDAVLSYLAAHGSRQVDAALAVLLPFSAVQPYARKKRSLVPPEMFYGRDAERRAVIDPEDTQVVFGGRGLGKSALLRSAKGAFEREPERVAVHIELSTVAIGQEAQGADAVWDVLLREFRGAGIVPQAGRRDTGKAYDRVRAGVLSWLKVDSRRRLLVMLDESDGFFEADAPRFLETNRLKELGQLAGAEGRAKVVFAGLHSVQRFAKLSNNTFKHLAQSPTMIGHLRPRHAYDLVTSPMGALGFRFASEELIHRILGYCSYQPFLLQMFCDRLVRHMHEVRRAGTGGVEQPPYTVAFADVEAVEGDPELRDDIIETFRDTLHLDPRYNIIACVLAHHAYEQGLDVRLSETELREECLSYWPRGFDGLDSEAFRAYLKEMVGLGLLADNRDLRGWRLRSANALRMMGTNDAVMTALVDADSEAVPAESIALAVRRPLHDGRRAPLTATQLDDLLGGHTNQVRLVLGSAATGIADVTETIRAVRDEFGDRFDLQEPQDRRRYEEALQRGRQGQRRIVLSDLARVTSRADTCQASLAAALERLPVGRGITRSVVLVSDPRQMEFWETLLADPEYRGAGLVRLRRHDRLSLQIWSRDTGLFGVSERQERLLETTGGWPVLVDRAQELAGRYQEGKALERLAAELAQPARAAELVDQVGLTAHRPLAAAFDAVVELLDGPAPRSDLVEAIQLQEAHPAPDAAVSCLEALGVFDPAEDDTYRIEPLLARAWPHRKP